MLLFGVSGPALGRPAHLGGLGSSMSDACNNACFNALDGDDLTACINACTNPTRTSCQSACGALSGDAHSTCVSACGNYPDLTGSNSGSAGSTSSGAGTPWYASVLTALSAGAGAALRPSGAAAVAPVAPPWYSSPVGIGVIALGVVAIVMLLKK